MKIQSPWMGRIKGSAGNMTGCKVYDKNVMRAKAFEVSNPNTAAQQTQRDFFASLVDLCSDFSDAQLRTLFPAKPKTMSRRNAITKQIAVSYEVDGTTKTIDFANIDTLGNAPVMDFGQTTCVIEDTKISIDLANSVAQNQELANNIFIVAVVNETKGVISFTKNFSTVSNGHLGLDAPSGWSDSDQIHAIPFITNVKAPATLGAFGSFIIKVRPEKK